MMTPEQIAAMRADAEAGTPGPWIASPHQWPDQIGCCPLTGRPFAAAHGVYNVATAKTYADISRIARVPDMETTIIAQADEIARLTEMLTVQWEGIPWRDGPPPAKWRDGRDVLVWAQCPVIASARVKGSWWHSEGVFADSEITYHAAVTLPHEKGQPG